MKKLLIPALAMLSFGCVQAAELSYTYLDIGYVRSDVDSFNDGSGFMLGGSYALNNQWFLHGQYTRTSFDIFNFDIDVSEIELGAGGHWMLSDRTDLVGKLAYLKVEADGPFGSSADDNGVLLSLGVRSRLTELVELEGGIRYADLDESGNDTSLEVAGRYQLTPNFSLGLRVRSSDDETHYGLIGRFRF